jgi:5-methylcytosine-specific restriction enzyme A
MPRRLPQPCRVPGCPRLDCAEHRALRQPWASSHPVERVRGRRNLALRDALFALDPLCVRCRAEGRATVATIRDHIVPLAYGGREQPDNTQPLCARCHALKTIADQRRTRR